MNNDILTIQTKEALLEYSKIDDIYSVIKLTFLELLISVWDRINKNIYKNEILAILNLEISDSICKCFTGRISRLVNCLNGFDSDVQITITKNEQISNILITTKAKIVPYVVETHKELFMKEMLERQYEKADIDEWVSYIE
jgi:hypothetical protein